MSGKNKGYLLPEVINPDRVCIQINVPNDFNHLMAFWGQMWELTYWNTWQRDDEKQGKDAAAVWLDVYKQARAQNAHLEGCEGTMGITDMRVQDCNLQVQYDGSETWVTIGSLTACAPPQTRVRIEDCTLQESLDAGETWQDRGEIECGEGGGGGTPTQLQVVDCQIQTSDDSGATWADVEGGAFYPIAASCPAIAFWARSTLPYLLGMDSTDDSNLFRLGMLPGGEVALTAYNRLLHVKYGALQENTMAFEVDGQIRLDNVLGDNGFIFENNGDLYLQHGIYLRDYSTGGDNAIVSSIVAQRQEPDASDFKGMVTWAVNDYINQKTLISGSTNGETPEIGVLGALPLPRQTITGDCAGNVALKAVLETLAGFGFITDETTLGEDAPPDPNDDAFREAFRCRVAAGAIDWLIGEAYFEAGDYLINDQDAIEPELASERVAEMFPYVMNAQFDFLEWCTALLLDISIDGDYTWEEHYGHIHDAIPAIKQLYYCALSEGGTLDAGNMAAFYADVAALDIPAPHGTVLYLFLTNFNVAAWAMHNSHGYFFANPLDCEFDSCEELEFWSMNWHWPLNQGDPAWTFENGTYTAFQGWRQTSISSALVMTINNSCSGFMMHFDANTGDQVQVVVIDKATNAPLAIEGGVSGVGDFEISWQAANESEWATLGIDVRLTSADLTDFDGFTGARLIHSCISGFGLSPVGGEVVGSCI
jgi:hypothetical protein